MKKISKSQHYTVRIQSAVLTGDICYALFSNRVHNLKIDLTLH